MTRVYLSVGSNIDCEANIRSCIARLRSMYAPLILSSVYQSRAVGFDGPDFYNMAVGFDTGLALANVYAGLRRVEAEHGRRRGAEKFSSRPLDIDLLLFGDRTYDCSAFDIPRREILQCAFVLLPLSEIAGDLVHPETGRTIADTWREFDGRDQPINRIEFKF